MSEIIFDPRMERRKTDAQYQIENAKVVIPALMIIGAILIGAGVFILLNYPVLTSWVCGYTITLFGAFVVIPQALDQIEEYRKNVAFIKSYEEAKSRSQ